MPGGISNASSAVGNVSLLNGHIQLAGKTILHDHETVTAGNVTLRTVSGGKTYYLLAAQLTISGTINGIAGYLTYGYSGDRILFINLDKTTTYAPAVTDHAEMTFPHPIPLAAGLTVVLNASANCTGYATIVGWEE